MKLELEDKELDYLAQVLGTRPYAEVAQLMSKISRQVQEQQQPPEDPPAKKPRAVNSQGFLNEHRGSSD